MAGQGSYTLLRDLKLGEVNLGIKVVPEGAAHLTLGSVNQDIHSYIPKTSLVCH